MYGIVDWARADLLITGADIDANKLTKAEKLL
jgi:hypothetical protein